MYAQHTKQFFLSFNCYNSDAFVYLLQFRDYARKEVEIYLAYLTELTFRDAISIEYNPGRFEACGSVEGYEQILYHVSQIFYYFLSVLLYSYCRRVTRWVGIHTTHNL